MTSTNDSEKLKKRQEQLAAWKQKKLQNNGKNDEEQKKIDRQKRIEEWKRKRQGKEESPVKPTISKPKPLIKLKSLKPSTPTVKAKRSVFDEADDQESHKPMFKKPTLTKLINPTEDADEEALDKFMESLNETDHAKTPEVLNESEESDVDYDSETSEDALESKLKMLQDRGKTLEALDHSKIEYKPFRKVFYKPSKGIDDLTIDEINQLRIDLSEIRVKGPNCPVPITKWSQLGLSSNIIEIFKKLNYDKPSPIQCQALPAIMSGRDIIGVAKTGSGKTLSFVLPMIRHVLDQDPVRPGEGPVALILTPTRELAIQINKEISNFSKSVTSCCCYGGSNIEPQIAELKKGVQVLVGTPGRVIDLLTVNSGRIINLRRVTYLVLDEADRMFDMGFEPQVNKILGQIRPERQTVLFSATFPKKLEILAKHSLQNPIEIIVGGINVVASEIDQKIELFKFESKLPEEINRVKFLKLVEILDIFIKDSPTSKVLIFVEKQDLADQLMVQLVLSDYNCTSIHGGKDQVDRKSALKDFSSATSGLNILIATSIAARGLDVKNLDLVVNYDAPSHMEDYIHRVGRTGRAGAKGTAITFVSEDQERAITDLVKVMPPPIDERLVEISKRFLDRVKQGKEKYSFGFGGKGLEKLQQQRDSAKDLERQSFEQTAEEPPKPSKSKSPSTVSPGIESNLPDFDIVEGIPADSSGPDRSKFHSRITINDLPQKVRWYVSNKESISEIIESTSTSITHKGQYYANNNQPKPKGPPKLYLLVEGLTFAAVEEANSLIRQRIIDGLETEFQSQPTGKYTV